jgi:hypothetical protein
VLEQSWQINFCEGVLLMATGAAPALDPKVEAETEEKTETSEVAQAQPVTFKQRIVNLLHEIFQGREEYSGWRQ